MLENARRNDWKVNIGLSCWMHWIDFQKPSRYGTLIGVFFVDCVFVKGKTYPCVQTSTSLLNSVLLERAPKDPPPPRRSTRAAIEPEKEASTPKKKGRPFGKKMDEKTIDSTSAEGWSPASSSSLPIETDPLQSSSPPKQQQEQGAKRRRLSRNVGGWISPNLAQVLDRKWLERDSDKFDLSAYVPQVGETVL